MVFNFGVMFGAILFGFLSDKFGRKKPFVAALVIQAIVGGVTAASPNFYVFTVLRFIVGALEQVRAPANQPHRCCSALTLSHHYHRRITEDAHAGPQRQHLGRPAAMADVINDLKSLL